MPPAPAPSSFAMGIQSVFLAFQIIMAKDLKVVVKLINLRHPDFLVLVVPELGHQSGDVVGVFEVIFCLVLKVKESVCAIDVLNVRSSVRDMLV